MTRVLSRARAQQYVLAPLAVLEVRSLGTAVLTRGSSARGTGISYFPLSASERLR